jgi:acylphosphatase
MKRIEVIFIGRVQGVGFRAATLDTALQHELVGWVRNEADGTVMLVAEGEKDEIERFLAAHRDRLKHFFTSERITEKPERGGYDTFEIRS